VEPWRKLDERPAYEGPYRRIVARRFERPDGTVADYEVKAEEAIAAVVALTEAREIVLVREFRVGPEEVLLELPGGALDPGESPEDSIRRELLEETGYTGELERVVGFPDDAYSTRVKHAFVATGCRRVAEPTPHEDEFLEVVTVSLAEFREHLRCGRLTDADVGYRGLDHLGLL
jgi:ADP-ribose pyrophosphatase